MFPAQDRNEEIGRVATERRGKRRAAFDGWVEVHVDGVRRLANGVDLSSDGIGIDFDSSMPALDTCLACEFKLPGISLALELMGAVAWKHGSRVGVRFDAVDPGLAELLENYVAGRL